MIDSRIPYFYIIQHKDTGIKYAGAKWGIDANPDTFMQERHDGYTTSSSTINDCLDLQPGVIYSVLEIILEEEIQIPFGCQRIKEYEDWFLKSNDCCRSDSWVNKTPPYMMELGSPEFKKSMILKYGVSCALRIKDSLAKFKRTNNERYSGNSPMHCQAVRKKHEKSIQAHYGIQYTNPGQVPEVKAKMAKTIQEKYGDQYTVSLQVPEVKAKILNTLQTNHGDQYTNYAQLPELKIKMIKTRHENFNKMSAEDIEKNKIKILSEFQAKYGTEYTNASQLPEIKQKSKDAVFNKYGVSSTAQIPFHCGQCDVHSRGFTAVSRYHKNHENIVVNIKGFFMSLIEAKNL